MVESVSGRPGTLRFAIAGLGTAGCMMIPAAVKHPNVELTAAADLGTVRPEMQANNIAACGYDTKVSLWRHLPYRHFRCPATPGGIPPGQNARSRGLESGRRRP